jgi:hypothetical protein
MRGAKVFLCPVANAQKSQKPLEFQAVFLFSHFTGWGVLKGFLFCEILVINK